MPNKWELFVGSSGQDIDWVSSWDAAKMVTGTGAGMVAVIK